MSGDINYKMKYEELKSKFMNSMDMAFRLGFEAGAQQANQNAMQQQQMQQQQQLNQPNNPDQEDQNLEEQQQNPDSQNPAGSELDQHIEKLESMLGKSDLSVDDLKKTVNDLKSLQANIKMDMELKKSAKAIPAIARALHKPEFKIGAQASHNMNSNAKTAVTMQHKIVNDIMKAFDEEEKRAYKEISKTLNIEGLIKG